MNILRLNGSVSRAVFGGRFHAEYWVCFTLNFCRLNGPVLCRILVGVLFILCCGRIGHFTISFGLVFVAFWSRRKCSIILLYGSILFVVQWSFFRKTFFEQKRKLWSLNKIVYAFDDVSSLLGVSFLQFILLNVFHTIF